MIPFCEDTEGERGSSVVVGNLRGVGVDDLHIRALVKGGRCLGIVGEVDGLENVLKEGRWGKE